MAAGRDDSFIPRERAWQIMQPYLTALANRKETEAVYVLSTAAEPQDQSRFDTLSDFDIGLIIDVPMSPDEWRPSPSDTYKLLRDRMPKWLPNFSFEVRAPWGNMEINVHQLVLAYEADPRTTWDAEKCDTYYNRSIEFYARTDRFAKLVECRHLAVVGQRAQRLVFLRNRLTWDIRVLPLRQAHRAGVECGHLMLNAAIDEIIEVLYLANDRYLPNKKWRLARIVDEEIISSRHYNLLIDAASSDTRSLDDLNRRIALLEKLCETVPELPSPGREWAEARSQFRKVYQLVPRTAADQARTAASDANHKQVYDRVNFELPYPFDGNHRTSKTD